MKEKRRTLPAESHTREWKLEALRTSWNEGKHDSWASTTATTRRDMQSHGIAWRREWAAMVLIRFASGRLSSRQWGPDNSPVAQALRHIRVQGARSEPGRDIHSIGFSQPIELSRMKHFLLSWQPTAALCVLLKPAGSTTFRGGRG